MALRLYQLYPLWGEVWGADGDVAFLSKTSELPAND